MRAVLIWLLAATVAPLAAKPNPFARDLRPNPFGGDSPTGELSPDDADAAAAVLDVDRRLEEDWTRPWKEFVRP